MLPIQCNICSIQTDTEEENISCSSHDKLFLQVVVKQTEKTADVEAEVIKTCPNVIYTPLETACH